jgi:PelA/Pel-15E family pectate lyase
MVTRRRLTLVLIALLSWSSLDVEAADRFTWSSFARRPDDWYRSAEGREVINNVLSHQSDLGSWPKNLDTSAQPFRGDRTTLKGTFDNGATSGEVRLLARAYRATQDERCRDSVVKAIDHILRAQYPTGGWPQFYPPGSAYHRHITFNDDTMVRLMELVRDVEKSEEFRFLDQSRRDSARRSFEEGIRCIFRCQVKVAGQLTVWCAQHDEKTLEPRPARAFEPVSLSGSESAGILMLLMSLDQPGPDVIQAVESGAGWFESSKLTGIKLDRQGGDLRVVKDPNAAPLWPRFVEIGTGRPIFSSRDSVIKYDIAEIDAERRNGYAWYGTWGKKVAERYARWQVDHPERQAGQALDNRGRSL